MAASACQHSDEEEVLVEAGEVKEYIENGIELQIEIRLKEQIDKTG